MMLAAADLGIGSGHSAVGDQDLARRMLGLPDSKILSTSSTSAIPPTGR